ncbi:hypothetical protein RFI_06565 [Reticulomyxa filosa]|uniref:Uncharacterized protein n=1 Tax=Reticulomyxa filosa TaxID=46433 RepID=X6NW71_RETFI|nr:hypothetical protein RFI_06565 [Reticulomyxa filosa]|eukprot:ETO30555.1 hypothetical protein RFI_06565 [Reticulomyxa filosa]
MHKNMNICINVFFYLITSDKIDIEKELANALKNLTLQVSKLQSDINKKERIYVTISGFNPKNDDEKQAVNGNGNTKSANSTPIVGGPNNLNAKERKEESWTRKVVIGLDENDLNIFRKEWVLLVFLCHQFQLYEIAVHRNTTNILFILGEMYFTDLLTTFQEVFEPNNKALIMDYDNPSKSIAAALQIYAQKRKRKSQNLINTFPTFYF